MFRYFELISCNGDIFGFVLISCGGDMFGFAD
jgi:hypothetical protein